MRWLAYLLDIFNHGDIMLDGKPLYKFDDARVLGKTIYFTDQQEAKKAAQGRGEWGCDASVWEKKVFIVDTAAEYERIVHFEEVQRAMNKLSEHELELIKKHLAGTSDDDR